jgi:hypothetical protein
LFNGDRSGGDVCDGFCGESCERVCDDHPADPETGTDPGTEMRDDRGECPFYPFYRYDVYDDRLLVVLTVLVAVSLLVLVVVHLLLPFYILNKEINFFLNK